jgi:DNA-binding transcriptional LysR family regulator
MNRAVSRKIEATLGNLRIADLKLFIAAAQLKNLGKSAALHHLSQSAASAAVQRVEQAFGFPLCLHEKRQFRLTSEGQLLLPRLESWIRQLQDLIISPDLLPLRLVTTHAVAQIAVPALLSMENVDFKHMRPDHAYTAILEGEADIALVLDNAPWKGVSALEIGRGCFQLYSKETSTLQKPVLLPEDQMEVLALQQSWQKVYGYDLPIKARIPSWSLIAAICAETSEVGFLPDFLANKFHLKPVGWQPQKYQGDNDMKTVAYPYRMLAIYTTPGKYFQPRLDTVLEALRSVFKTN